MIETDIEHEMVNNVSKLLLELGKGFAYIGEQYPLKVEDEEFFIDLLFYNYLMHCFFAVELKTEKFVPEYAGKMNFYLSVCTLQSVRAMSIMVRSRQKLLMKNLSPYMNAQESAGRQ